MTGQQWDILVLTAGNEKQAALYREQLALRDQLGLLAGFRNWHVVADPLGRRIGSGGSTLFCLLELLNRQGCASSKDEWHALLESQRILIVHAGGDSRRLPAYGTCGKVFVPLPIESESALATTLFDYQIPVYASLPPIAPGRGQVVISSGDVLLDFDPKNVSWGKAGIAGLGCRSTPEQATRHGVYCTRGGAIIRRYLQKPSLLKQHEFAAVDQYGEVVLDIGVLTFDATAAVRLLTMCDVQVGADGRLAVHGEMLDAIMTHGLDFYREICCAIGTDTTRELYLQAAHDSGSRWPDTMLDRVFDEVSAIPASVSVLKSCEFLHFGSTREILASGCRVFHRQQQRLGCPEHCLMINSRIPRAVAVPRVNAWVEGCRIRSQLVLHDHCVLIGVDVDEPLTLPGHACLDVLPGRDRNSESVHFVRCYHDDDPLQINSADDFRLCGKQLNWWLAGANLDWSAVWDNRIPATDRCIWNARLFPAVARHADYRNWLWMLEPAKATNKQLLTWAAAERFSFQEMALLADVSAFHSRRTEVGAQNIRDNLHRRFRGESCFSAKDLAYVIGHSKEPSEWLSTLIGELKWHAENADPGDSQQAFALSRITHSLSAAIEILLEVDETATELAFQRAVQSLAVCDREWLRTVGLGISNDSTVRDWAESGKELAFQQMRGRIISSAACATRPRNSLRPDEIVWGRAPARLDLGGGWTDTPPYSLECGGCVVNAAVHLNGQPPIQAFARVIGDPVIRIRSIDVGAHVQLSNWQECLDCTNASGEFSLVKAALAISGFAPERGESLREMLTEFGGGLEITTLAAIPKGSGLGTSSIMGAVILAVINRVLGNEVSSGELFHQVLCLEQKLTTGGGWQDQVGGVVGGLKLITTQPGMVPCASIHYVPSDILDPQQNGGRTLLYYTGITRLARNILQQVVGRYLNRDREALRVLEGLRQMALQVSESLARKNLAEFGGRIDQVWELNKQLDPDSSNPQIEAILARIRSRIYGAKLLGAGGGGFLLLVCRSHEDAGQIRAELLRNPPNNRARFFDFSVSTEGLAVSVC